MRVSELRGGALRASKALPVKVAYPGVGRLADGTVLVCGGKVDGGGASVRAAERARASRGWATVRVSRGGGWTP